MLQTAPPVPEALGVVVDYALVPVCLLSKGDCWEYAPMESVNGTLKVECVHGEHFRTREEARQAIIEYIGYYNTERRHSSIGYLPPAKFEQRWRDQIKNQAPVAA